MRITKCLRSALALTLLLMAGAARAQLSLTFTQPVQTGLPGTTLTFAATLLNTGASELFLNGDFFSLGSPNLTLDDAKFFTNTPLSLPGGESFTGDIFDVRIAPATLQGIYAGSFSVLGGASANAQNTLATGNFQVVVPQAAIPESGTGVLLAAGALPLLGIARRRRR